MKGDASKIEHEINLKLCLMFLVFLFFAWLAYVYVNQRWIIALLQVISWLTNPTINYNPLHVNGIPFAFLATMEILILGTILAHMLLPNEEDKFVRRISAIGLGVGMVSLVTIVLGIFGNLYILPLNAMILLLCAGFLLISFYRQRKEKECSIREFFKTQLSLWRFEKLAGFKTWLLPCLAIGILYFLCYYHALFTVILHWDAVVYHAVMAVIMYNYHGIPVIAGPSIGIEMSANFPPLFSAIGAYYYIQIGGIEDFYLRAVSPTMGILTILATYKIGEVLAGRKYGMFTALFLALTPLFFRYSIYATSYSTLTFFSTTTVLFLFFGMFKGKTNHWVLCGLFYGFTLLTSYLALYLIPFFIIALIYHSLEIKNCFKMFLKIASLLILPAFVTGGVWYLRNLVLLGNPIYPSGYTLFDGKNIDPLILETTFNGIRRSGINCLFGGEIPWLERIFVLIFYRTHFPSISLITLTGIALILTLKDKKFLLLATWPITLTFFILSGVAWCFPRHFVFILPGFALVSSLPVVKALGRCKKCIRKSEGHRKETHGSSRKTMNFLLKEKGVALIIAIILVLAFVFPSLTLAMGGKLAMDNLNDWPCNDYLWLLKNPNAEKWFVLERYYQEALAWRWLDEHLKEGEKVATVENRIYHIKNCDNNYFFYLDGWEARELYHITDPLEIVKYLHKENVKYVVDVAWARTHGHFDILPMAQFLSSPYFPTIIERGGNPNIYNVGPIETPITANSPLLLSINQEGWSELQEINGWLTQSIIAGSDFPKLYVVTSSLTLVKITYLDIGTDKLSIHLHNPDSKSWTYNYVTIAKNNTHEWQTFEFSVSSNEKGFVEFSLHSYYENFIISKIEATSS